MRIDVWSDIVCPWCYLGMRRLERAVERLDWADEVEVHWRAFQLDPRASAEPGDLRLALERKYGPGAFEAMTARLRALGPADDIDYRFDLALRVNTFDAHRLMAWADGQGTEAQQRLGRRLFQAYFTEGENIADPETLARLAGDAGLDADAAAEIVATDAFADEVRDDILEARELGVTGVPFFLVAGKVGIPGAQDVETIQLILDRTRTRLAAPSSG